MVWLYIVATIVILASWVAVWYFALPWWMGALVTGLAVFVVLLVVLLRRLRAARRARALENELMRQAAQQAEHARPDRRPEILALQARMKQAIAGLKKTKLGGKGGRSALYALPWYVIIGPPASGKTTALEKSGLAFTAGASGPRVRGTAGTRNCDWWFSQEAILLDTAGRFAMDDDDQDEWLAFLDTVRRFRPERPLEGVVVAVSLSDLMAASDTQLEELAVKLRARIDEIMVRLEMVLPIYLMFTKADLIAGFVEYWSDLSKPQRAKPWGATFALGDARLAEPARAFEAEFDELVRVLHARMLDRLTRERVPEARTRVLQFPIEFQSLRAPLAKLLEALCQSNPYQETPVLRGFYFTSGTQVGRPMERVLANMVRGFNLRQAPTPGEQPQPQSYFVTDMFRSVIFPDRDLGTGSMARVRRRSYKQLLYAAAAVGIMLLVLVPAILNYVNNADLVRSTVAQLGEVARIERESRATVASAADTLGILQDRVQVLEHEGSGVRIPGWYGSQAAAALTDPVRKRYVDRLRRAFDGPIKEQVTARVRAVGDLIRTDTENFLAAYDDLKLYVMLTTAPEHLDSEWASDKLSAAWVSAFRSQGSGDPEILRGHAKYYLDALAHDKTWLWPIDEPVVTRARSKLSWQPVEELQYNGLISNAKGLPAVRAEKIFYGPSAQFVTWRGALEVPAAYTKQGWEKVKSALGESGLRFDVEPWVLGGASVATDDVRKKSSDHLRELYFSRYERAWADFIAGLNVQIPSDLPMSVLELRTIAEADGPYIRLFRALADNVTLDMSPPTLVGKAREMGTKWLTGAVTEATGIDAGSTERVISPVERHYATLVRFAWGDGGMGKPDGTPTALSQYLAQLTTLEVALQQLTESHTEPTQEFEAELGRTAAVVQKMLGGFDPATRLVLDPILMNPIRGSRAGVVSTGVSYLGAKWKAEVWETWSGKLAGRYPFVDTNEEVALAEVAEFFRPSTGVIWKFFDKNLSDKLERTGNGFAPKASNAGLIFRADFLRCLGHAQLITDALFGSSPEIMVPFGVRMHPVGPNISEVTLRIDGQAAVYRNEPERWLSAQWPGKGAKGASLEVKGNAGFNDQIPRNGDFGVFRLLAAGNLASSRETGGFTATWTLTRAGEAPVTIDFRPGKSVHPFSRDFFQRLKCPPEVSEGGAAAPAAPVP